MPKFAPVDLSAHFNGRFDDPAPWSSQTARAISALPAGRQVFWGIPFRLAQPSVSPAGSGPRAAGSTSRAAGRSAAAAAGQLVVAGARRSRTAVRLPVGARGRFVVFAHFCDSRASRKRDPGMPYPADSYAQPVVTSPGEQLASYVLEYADGSEAGVAIRRRFEIDQLQTRAQNLFAARHSAPITALDFRGPSPRNHWGRLQTSVNVGFLQPLDRTAQTTPPPLVAFWTIYALPNPNPKLEIKAVRIEPTGAASFGIGAITLFNGAEYPLRHRQLESVLIEGKAVDKAVAGAFDARDVPDIDVDLGVIARKRIIGGFEARPWLRAPVTGWGEDPNAVDSRSLVVDVSASADATLTVGRSKVDLTSLYESGKATSADGSLSATLLTPRRTWAHVTVTDSATGKPTPTRVHLRSPDGRYWPPYGHRHEVNDNWFEDYGADLKLGSTEYAYVEGEFQAEVPEGDLYVEVVKGFEYEPLRQKVTIRPGQRELKLELKRIADTRPDGWVTADSHTHFLSTETARLQAQAEGINIINLLASQWGDLYTNVGDFTGALSGSSTDDAIVWVGTENRQHFLGHISLLGYNGKPAYPMTTGGPTEGYIGDGVWRAMSEWADECRSKGGVVVIPHFPFPYSEVIAEVVRGKVDGLELRDWYTPTMDTFAIHEWYRLLNCGYRVAAIGGTDKMSAGMPVGGVRTYANIGRDRLTFDNWGKAVRAGKTYTTSGPLMTFSVEGHDIGDVIRMKAGGGHLRVQASAIGTMPFHRLQVVFNGNVVAETSNSRGAHSLSLSEDVEIDRPGWLAARCVSEHTTWHCWPIKFGAHTSPVYVEVAGSEVFDGPTAEYLITVLEGGITWLNTLAIPANAERHVAIRRVFDAGIAELRSHMPADSHDSQVHSPGGTVHRH
jgi:hypothetical protein